MIPDCVDVRTKPMNEGKLEQNPPAELIREILSRDLSGALRLVNGQARAAIYFETGKVVFAASNLRSHRLLQFLSRNKVLSETQLAALPAKATDEELRDYLLKNELLKPTVLEGIQTHQVSEILRAVLLWTSGEWQFDSRVKIAGNTLATLDMNRLLLECARHLPADHIAARFGEMADKLDLLSSGDSNLLPREAFILSRVNPTITLKELLAVSGLAETDALRAVYGLSLSGSLQRDMWPSTSINGSSAAKAANPDKQPAPNISVESGNDEQGGLQALFARLDKASDHYEVLNIARQATADDVKTAYHALARRYHPDRFHQSDAELRGRVDSAFARIARAYETLNDSELRAAYDAAHGSSAPRPGTSPNLSNQRGSKAEVKADGRAEHSFKQGLAAKQDNQHERALRFFAEAASIEPRQARYRAEYGRALIAQPQTRRIAEIELKAAIALDPGNASHRVLLAELYKVLGLRRRAEAELQRALTSDPQNEAARQLLASLKK